jgi:prolyl 4-hydroxylase
LKLSIVIGITSDFLSSIVPFCFAQVLKYEVGQRYTLHHDSIESDNALVCGPRMLTFFLYLSDVDKGGETVFPKLGISVTPKKGRALLWPSITDRNATEIDPRMIHEAKAVVKGRKFAANGWIHVYDYMTPNLWGCTGTFDEF